MKKPWWLRWFGVLVFAVFLVQALTFTWAPAGSMLFLLGKGCAFMALATMSLAGMNVWQQLEKVWEQREYRRYRDRVKNRSLPDHTVEMGKIDG